MRNMIIAGAVVCLCCGMFLGVACAKKAASAGEAIQSSQSLKTVEEKVNYLMKQAEAFYSSKEFQQAVDIAQYVLTNLDKDSQSAKSLIERAKNELQTAAQKAVGDVSNKIFGQ